MSSSLKIVLSAPNQLSAIREELKTPPIIYNQPANRCPGVLREDRPCHPRISSAGDRGEHVKIDGTRQSTKILHEEQDSKNIRNSERKNYSLLLYKANFVQEGKSKEDLSREKRGQVRGGRQKPARLTEFAQGRAGRWGRKAAWRAGYTAERLGRRRARLMRPGSCAQGLWGSASGR